MFNFVQISVYNFIPGLGSIAKYESLEDRHIALTINLEGRFAIHDEAGNEMPLHSAKGRALIALLCCSPGMIRTRLWLQEKLWSDRGPEQAAGSLRQTLSQLRKSLGESNKLLVTDRLSVRLEETKITLVERDKTVDAQFLEGIGVRDQAFSGWLEQQRQLRGGGTALSHASSHIITGAPAACEALVISTVSGDDEVDQITSQIVAGNIAQNLRESLGIDVLVDQQISGVPRQDVTVKVGVASRGGRSLVHCQCAELPSGNVFWSGSRTIASDDLLPQRNDHLSQLVNEVTLATCTMLARSSHDNLEKSPTAIISHAVRQIFSMDRDQHLLADQALKEISEGQLTGIGLSWRVILRVVMSMERMVTDPETTREEIAEFGRKAEEHDPLNSIVLASNAYAGLMIFDDVAKGAELGQKSTEINEANPFGWLARAFASIRANEFEEGNNFMSRAQMLERISPHRYWWDCMFAVSATANNQFALALNTFERAHAQSPNFKPPLRYLLSLHAASGEQEKANDILQKLQAVEPDFSVNRLVNDDDYPAHILRHTGLTKSGLIEDMS